MSDDRKTAKSRRVSDELHAEVAARLGVKPAEVAVYENPDGMYAVDSNGHRMLLRDEGGIAWYGDKAPNPAYPLVHPTVDIEEADSPPGPPLEPVEDVPVVKKPGPPPRPGAAKK